MSLTTESSNFFQLIDIDEIIDEGEVLNMVDIEVEEDNSFSFSYGLIAHNSARGSILQKRNSKSDGVYSLKGKVKNARTILDLASNAEIVDLMNILNIEPNDGKNASYKNIVIATDWDPDGIGHIASLLINLFFKWFPSVIDQRRLHVLITPLISVDTKDGREYFHSQIKLTNWQNENPKIKINNVRYLKGLGSLDIKDWEYVMFYRDMWVLYKDRSAKKMLNMAFGNSSNLRKKWLKGEPI